MHVVVARLDAEQPEEGGEQLCRQVRVEARELALHTLGTARGARGVVHGRAGRAVLRDVGRLPGQERLEVAEPGNVADREPGAVGDLGLVGRRHREIGEPLVTDEGLGVAVSRMYATSGAESR